MKRNSMFILILVLTGVSGAFTGFSQEPTASSGSVNYLHPDLLPVPHYESYTGKTFTIDRSWSIKPESNISPQDEAIQSLVNGMKDRVNMELALKSLSKSGISDSHCIRLIIRPGSVVPGPATDTNRMAITEQAYSLKLNTDGIIIKANASEGLFYGIQTLLQLFKQDNGNVLLPEGEIIDWPDVELRIIYFDCAHHLQKMDAFRRIIREAAFYKINGIALKLEGHFQFNSAKPVVEPFAISPSEYQELTDYAKNRYIQLIPYLDAPAHVSFILKHPEYQHLRAIPKSNYELSVVNPETRKLIMSMFDDLIDANHGCKYVLLSTDEAYYVGKAENEIESARKAGGNGKLLADFIAEISNHLHEKGRDVIFWGEFPLTVQDIDYLPSHLIDGEYNGSWAASLKNHGIRQMIYTSTQGEEPLFPGYYAPPDKITPEENTSGKKSDNIMMEAASRGRVGEIMKTIRTSIEEGKSDFMGVIVAAWADAGLNPETFWLGYTTGSAVAWNNSGPSAFNLTERFYNSFYGPGVYQMSRVYQMLCIQADFWNKSWDWQPSKLRSPILGNSRGIYDKPKPASDQILPLLPVPSGKDLSYNSGWKKQNAWRLEAAVELIKQNDELIDLLKRNIEATFYQKYNLQVLLSVAQLCRQNLKMLTGLQNIDNLLKKASDLAFKNPSEALNVIDQALKNVRTIKEQRNELFNSVTTLWYMNWQPRVEEANGRKYLDQADDIKDHLPVRTVDMSYLIYRELNYPLGKWMEEVIAARNEYAKYKDLPQWTEIVEWRDY